MKLQNNLYKIQRLHSDVPQYTIELLGNSPIYSAHFPGQPITPGVCIIQIASELLEEYLGAALVLREVVNAKFLAVITPDETHNVDYYLQKITELENGIIKISASVFNQEKTFAKLTLLYGRN